MQIILEAFFLGLVGGIVPGSILTILLVSVMQGGFSSGARAFFWSLAAELTVVSLLLILMFSAPLPHAFFSYIGIIGGLVLFYFAWQVMSLTRIERPNETQEIFTAGRIYLLAATNAPLYIFWITVCAPLIWQLSTSLTLFSAALYFMLAFEFGWTISTFAVMLFFVRARNVLTNSSVMKKVYIGVAIFMVLLGMRIMYSSVNLLV